MSVKQNIIRWAKTHLGIYDMEDRLRERISRAEDYIRDRTTVHLDAYPRADTPDQVIVIGRYRGGDYVRTFNIYNKDLVHIVPILKDMERYASLGRVDHIAEVSGFIKHEFEKY